MLAVGLLLTAPATLLQLGLRDSTAPWFFTNDSTYQIELGGDLLLDLDNPYGHDYRESGLERFYTRDGSVSERVREREVALEHFAYFPGAVDQRGGVAAAARARSTTTGCWCCCATSLMLRGRARLPRAAGGAARARRAAGLQPDRGALGLVRAERRAQPAAAGAGLRARHRRRFGWAAATPGGGDPAQAVRARGAALPRADALAAWAPSATSCKRAALAFGGVLAVGILPFLIADPVAFYEDTISYGAGTYRIVGYGLSAILVRTGVVADRDGAYPFALIALLTWVPLTVWLLLAQRRAGELWLGAAGFAVSILWLMFIGRDVQQLLPGVADDRRRRSPR